LYSNDQFRQLVAVTHKFPCVYQFKFVVPAVQTTAVRALVTDAKVSARTSAGGRYTALTLRAPMQSPDQVVSIYEKAKMIKGVIAL